MRNKPYHHGDLRAAIIEKGIEMINESGVHSLSLRKVARLCGVSEAAPYAHFANKEELLRAIEKHITCQFTAVLKESVKEIGETVAGYVSLGCAFAMFFARNRQYYNLIYYHLSIKAGGEDEYEPFDFIVKFMEKMFDNINYPKETRQRAFIAHLAMIQGLTTLTVINTERDMNRLEESVRDLLSTNYLVYSKNNFLGEENVCI